MRILLEAMENADPTSMPRAPTSDSSVPVGCLQACKDVLSVPSTTAQLTAAGYNVGQLESRLDAALQAASAIQEPSAEIEGLAQEVGAAAGQHGQTAAAADHHVSAEALTQLVQQLGAVGEALSTLAISSACNNPTCSNISGPSEADLVKGSSSTYGGCRAARYCCKACQNKHWKLHRPVCKALAAARAGSRP
jgi:hypothetical protein